MSSLDWDLMLKTSKNNVDDNVNYFYDTVFLSIEMFVSLRQRGKTQNMKTKVYKRKINNKIKTLFIANTNAIRERIPLLVTLFKK